MENCYGEVVKGERMKYGSYKGEGEGLLWEGMLGGVKE